MKDYRRLQESDKLRILERDGFICAYCLGDATEVDHVIPYAWKIDDTDENLVACCHDCNMIAEDKVFQSLQEKYEYINSIRKSKKWQKRFKSRISICTRCKKSYKPRINGSTVFLCSTCVDIEWNK